MRPALILPLAALAILAPVASAAPTFMGLGIVPGKRGCDANDLSSDGSIVVGGCTAPPFDPSAPVGPTTREAFRWTQESGAVGMGYLPGGGLESAAADVSADGSTIVGGSDSESGADAFRWTQAAGMVSLGRLPGTTYAIGLGVSADGSVVVGGSGGQAFRWTQADGMVAIGDGTAWAVSANGSVVVGGSGAALGYQGFRWTQADGMVAIGDGVASDVSADGSAVVGVTTSGNNEPFRWTQAGGGLVRLGNLPGAPVPSGRATSISADGSVVVGESNGRAFIWDEANGMRPLDQVLTEAGADLTGWTLRVAEAISPDGLVIVGSGRNPQGFGEPWIAVIPEPSTALLLAGGLVALAMRRRPMGRG